MRARYTRCAWWTGVQTCALPVYVQEFLDYGLLGWAMSRLACVWVGFKCQTETVESAASVSIDPQRLQIQYPDFQMPPGGLNIRWPDAILEQELRLQQYKVYAAQIGRAHV